MKRRAIVILTTLFFLQFVAIVAKSQTESVTNVPLSLASTGLNTDLTAGGQKYSSSGNMDINAKQIIKTVRPLHVKYINGCIIPDSIVEYWKNHKPQRLYPKASITAIDWSNNDSPIKDQGPTCGSCWAFAATAYIENLGNQNDLSEQVLVSCSGSGGCGGGNYIGALNYFQSTGVPDESCFPYAQSNGECSSMCSNPLFKERISSVSNTLWGMASVDNLKAQLQSGPLIVRMLVPEDNSFYDYRSGIYDYNGSTISDSQGHAVLLVGYDDSQQCFKAKNSWGTYWGESGYFRIAYDDVADDVQFGSYAINGSGVYTEGFNSGPSISITNPTDTSIWHGGSVYTITWTDNIADNVDIFLYLGSHIIGVIASSVPSNGSYTFQPSYGSTLSDSYRICIVSSADPSIYDFSDYFTISIPVNCPDAYEPNNSLNEYNTTAFSTAFGSNAFTTSIDANMRSTSDWDVFRLNTTATGTLTIAISNPPVDVYIELYDKNRNYLSRSDYQGNEQIVYSVTTTGYYYIVIGSNNTGYPCSNYTLSVNWTPSGGNCTDGYEPNNSIDNSNTTAFSSSFGTSSSTASVTAKISYAADWDIFRINVIATGTLTVSINNPPADLYLEIYDKNQKYLGRSDNMGSEQITLSLSTTGYYYIVIGSSNGESSCSNYTAAVSWVYETFCADSYEFNNSYATANTTAFPTELAGNSYSKSISATLHNAADWDIYRIKATTTGTLTISVNNPPADIYLQLNDKNYASLRTSNNAGSEQIVYTVPSTGFYYIVVSSSNGGYSCSNYTLVS